MSLRSRFVFFVLTAALLAAFALPAQAQFTTITVTDIQNGDSLPLALGTMCWLGTNNAGTPLGYRAGSSGQTITAPVCRDIVNGAVTTTYKGNTIGTLKVADTTLTQPANVCYKVTVVDSSTGKVVLGSYAGAKSGYDCVQPSGATWSFDTYTPAGTPGVVQIAGPVGPQGPAGPATVTTDTATVLPADANPAVSNTGTTTAAVFHFNLPRAPQLTLGTVTASTPAAGPSVTNTGTSGDAIFNLNLPRAPLVSIGSVTTGSPGGVASASSTTDANGDVSLNLTIPAGVSGTTTTTGATGDFAISGKLSAHEAITGLDATTFFAADMCGSINAAWTYAVGKGWTSAIVDARGFHGNQNCSTWMFANVPYVPGLGCHFSARLLLGDVDIWSDVSQTIPCNSTLRGTANNNVGAHGTTIHTSNAYYTQVPMPYAIVQMGYSGSTWTGSTPPEGARIEYVAINGNPRTGTNSAPTTCLINQYSQENTGGEFLSMDGCIRAISRQMDPTSSIFGALNDGPWKNIHVNFNGIPDSLAPQARCIDNGTERSGLGTTRGFENVSCNIAGLAVQPLEAVRFSGDGFRLAHSHFEGFKEDVIAGEDFLTTNFEVDDITNVSFASPFTTTNVMRVANNGHAVKGSINLLSGAATLLQDDQAGTSISNASQVIAYAYPPTSTTPTVSVHSASYTMTTADSNTIHGFNAFGSTATVTLPATVPASWNARIINYNPSGVLVLDPNGHFMNGSTSPVTLPAGQSFAQVFTNGTNFYVSFGTITPTIPTPTIWTDTTISTDYTVLSTDSTKSISAGCSVNCTVTLPATVPAAGFRLRVINSQGSSGTPSVVTISRNGNLLNGQGNDITLTYEQSAEIWVNGGATTYRASVSTPNTYFGVSGTASAPIILPYATKQKVTLTANATPTIAGSSNGFCTRLYIIENATGGFTWTWPSNMKGGMAINTAATKTNAQEFCYDVTSGNWEAANAGTSY